MVEKHAGWRGYKSKTVVKSKGGTGGIWFLGFVGALVYYLHFRSGTFWLVIWAIIKALLWPAFLVYRLLLHMGA